MKYLLVSLGGVLGANARLLIGAWIAARWERGFPLGTFLINVSGSLLIGIYTAAAQRHGWHENGRFFCCVGFLGAFTTFSTFSLESLKLLQDGHPDTALKYILGSLLCGLASAAAGWWLGSKI